MKKTFKTILAVSVAACTCLTAVACGGGSGGGNGGSAATVEVVAISQNEYADAEKALKAYVDEQLAYSRKYTVDDWNGTELIQTERTEEVVSAQYVSHSGKADMKPTDVKLDDTTGIKTVSKIELKAKVAPSPEGDAEPEYEDVTQTVYLLDYGDSQYRYMVSTPVLGERLTNGYLKAVTDYAKYANCTVAAVSTEKDTGDDKASFAEAFEYRFTGNALLQVHYRDEARFNARTPGGTADDYDDESYLAVTDDGMITVNKEYDDEANKFVWKTEDFDGYSSISEALRDVVTEELFGYFDFMPAALFTKTATGFEYKTDVMQNSEDSSTRTESRYAFTLTGGKITGIDMSMTETGTEGEDEIERYMAQIGTFTAFGSTKVTLPAESATLK